MLIPGGSTTTSQADQKQIDHYASLLDKKYPGNLSGESVTLADDYRVYMAAHPEKNPKTVYDTIIYRLKMLGQVPKTIGDAIGAVGTATGQIGKGTVKGLNIPKDILGGLDLGSMMLRVGEVILGIVLIGVGIAKLTGADNVVSKAALSAGKLAML